ncbi:MAG: SRPBCC family protein [Candidatus Saccharimonadales bacterium]
MIDYSKINGTSTEAVEKATSKGWQEWCEMLDALGADKMTHKEIASMLYEKGYIDNGWWCQQVTVGYEYARGRRVVGQTKDAGFEIGVQKTFDVSVDQAWQLLLTEPGLSVWLGALGEDFHFAKGEAYETADGTHGEIRSYTLGERLRLTWQPKDWDHSSTLQIYVLPTNTGASIRFHHEKLANAEEREAMREHWRNVLDKIEKLV